MEGQSGSFELPLTRFGGRFGKDTDTPTDEIINDDGISHMIEGGLALKIQYEMLQNSSCRIFANSLMYETITPDNVMMYAIRHYDNPQCEGEKEFNDDLKRFKYIKRLLRKYYETNILKERLLLNHIIVLNNVFGTTASTTLLLFKIQQEYCCTKVISNFPKYYYRR